MILTDNEPEFVAPALQIFVGPTWIKFRCDKYGVMGNGINIVPFVSRNLQNKNWVAHLRRYVVVSSFITYDNENGMAIFPRYVLNNFMKYLGNARIELKHMDPVTPKKAKMAFKNNFQLRDTQVPLVEWITDGKSAYKPISMQTGGGKSLTAIAAAIKRGHPTLIILHDLVEQWYKAIRQFTKLSSTEIVVIQGYQSLATLWASLCKGYKPKIVIFSLRTAVSYIDHTEQYAGLPTFAKFQTACGFGTKIQDEVHMHFHAKTKVDMHCNIANNIYLSATYLRTNPIERRIFDTVFPMEMRYGSEDWKKYTVVCMVQYGIGVPSNVSFVLAKGYNHSLYEKYILQKRGILNAFRTKVIYPLVYMYFVKVRKPKQKLFVLTQTRNMAMALAKSLQEQFRNLKTDYYFSGVGKHGNDNIFTVNDIIVSTHKSCGTGRDVKNLKTCINTVSFSSPVLARQVMGRLRELEGEETIYIDIWNREVGSHYRHYVERAEIYKRLALRYEERQL